MTSPVVTNIQRILTDTTNAILHEFQTEMAVMGDIMRSEQNERFNAILVEKNMILETQRLEIQNLTTEMYKMRSEMVQLNNLNMYIMEAVNLRNGVITTNEKNMAEANQCINQLLAKEIHNKNRIHALEKELEGSRSINTNVYSELYIPSSESPIVMEERLPSFIQAEDNMTVGDKMGEKFRKAIEKKLEKKGPK